MQSNTKEFIEKAKRVHGDKYDYSRVNYIKNSIKVEIICPVHGSFFQTPNLHLLGSNCQLCAKENRKKALKSNTKEFIEKAKRVHGDKYDYSKVNYINDSTKVEIICPTHGSFLQTPNKHLIGHGCSECKKEKISSSMKNTTEYFLKNARAIHGDKYDYSRVVYNGKSTKVEIICKKHGSFFQTPDKHINSKHGCPKCRSSHGEIEIRNFLQNSNIIFEEQKRFKGCKDKDFLPFDFYIPSLNVAIEYNGRQHYEPNHFMGGEKQLHLQRHHDWLKRKYCRDNNIRFIAIKFDESVDKILNSML